MASSSSSWASEVTFEAFCAFLEKTAKDPNKKGKMAKLELFMRDVRAVHASRSRQTQDSLYPLMRLLLSPIDRERGAYGIKETVLARIYIDLLKLGPTSADAKKLKDFRAPKAASASAGDFAAILYDVIRDRHYADSK